MIKKLVQTEINKAAALAGYDVPDAYSVSTPPKREWGDFSTNVALMIGQNRPELEVRQVADEIVCKLRTSEVVDKAEIAGPGFINITMTDETYFKEIKEIIAKGETYGQSQIGKGKKTNVEYVSANPTGPLHIGNARGGPLGEGIANLYKFLGYEVEKEFYVNDIGGQIDKLAESLLYWYEVKADTRVSFPEGGYPGDYVKEISEQIQSESASELKGVKDRAQLVEFFKKEGLAKLVRGLKEDCELIGIKFDRWSYQSDIEYSGKTDDVIKVLVEKGATTKKEGALWFDLRQAQAKMSQSNLASEETGIEDRESVLRKSDEKKTITYFADDIAYHKEKFDRGNNILIDVWGANHHGHIPRIKLAMAVLGYRPDDLNIILYQYVRLKNEGEVFRMAKREGTVITLRQVIESGVAPDAFKYFILAQNPNTPFDFDIKLASDTSDKNPVYYIKYAHARICSILDKAGDKANEGLVEADLSLLNNDKEITLLKELIKFPDILHEIHQDFQIQALPHFVYKISGLFHDFYTNCQVLSDDENLTRSRIALILATKYVLANSLGILGIEAPKKM